MTWGLVEGGAGVIAACLPTLKPYFHSRMLESIVNSVRSVLSIGSTHSDARKGSDTDGLAISPESYELANRKLYSGPNHKITTQIESSSEGGSQEVPDNRILAQTGVHMNEGGFPEP